MNPSTTLNTDPANDRLVTVWDKRDTPIASQYGNISYERWCELEAARISRPLRAAMVLRRGLLVCVAWN